MGIITKQRVINILKEYYDPEIPIDLWNLGLIYDIQLKNDLKGHSSDLNILMSLTTPGCGMGSSMAADITAKLKKLESVKRAHVQFTFDPPWNPAMISQSEEIEKENSPRNFQPDLFPPGGRELGMIIND